VSNGKATAAFDRVDALATRKLIEELEAVRLELDRALRSTSGYVVPRRSI
jgi:hypothetical protein